MGKKYFDNMPAADKAALSESLRVKNKITPNIPNSSPTLESPGTNVVFQFDVPHRALISDDGKGNGFPSGGFKEIFGSLKFQTTAGENENWGAGNVMTLAQAQSLYSDGYEFIHHIHASDNLELNENEVLNWFESAKSLIGAFGLGIKNASWYQGISNPPFRSVIRNFYRSAASTMGSVGPWINIRPVNQYRLVRVSMDDGNYNFWLSCLDRAISEKALVIFYGHPYVVDWYNVKKDDDGTPDESGDYTWQKISRLLDYIKANEGYNTPGGVSVCTIDDALDNFECVIDVGYSNPSTGLGVESENNDIDESNEYFRVDKKGYVKSRTLDHINFKTTFESSYVGRRAGFVASGNNNVAIGVNAFKRSDGDHCISIGNFSSQLATGDNSVGIGSYSLDENKGNDSTAVGYFAGKKNTANNLTAFGSNAGLNNTGLDVVAIGHRAADGNTQNDNTFIGKDAGRTGTAAQCVAIGKLSLSSNSGIRSIGIGMNAGLSNTGEHLVAVGYQAARQNTGLRLTAIGYQAGYLNSGIRSVGVGYDAARSNSGDYLVAIGFEAGKDNTEDNLLLIEQRAVNAIPLIKGYFDSGAIILGAPAIAVADATMGASRVSFYLDEAGNKLKFKVKYADGTTIKRGEIALA